jgi:hypothetical protein
MMIANSTPAPTPTAMPITVPLSLSLFAVEDDNGCVDHDNDCEFVNDDRVVGSVDDDDVVVVGDGCVVDDVVVEDDDDIVEEDVAAVTFVDNDDGVVVVKVFVIVDVDVCDDNATARSHLLKSSSQLVQLATPQHVLDADDGKQNPRTAERHTNAFEDSRKPPLASLSHNGPLPSALSTNSEMLVTSPINRLR